MLNIHVRDTGAVGDGVTLDTEAIQKAIDRVGLSGGGRVTISDGKYLCGRIDLRSGVDLHIEADGVLLGSADGYDFPEIETDFWDTDFAPRFNRRCMIYAEGCENVALTGRGKIDCQGEAYIKKLEMPNRMWRYTRNTTISPARVALFMGCRDVLVEDVTMCNQPAGWSYWVCDCDRVHFSRAKILANVEYPNNDGIHINCSRDVTVSDCVISCGDDAVIVRAYSLPMRRHVACERVTVTNCALVSHSSGIRVGWINDGVIRDCVFSNLSMTDTHVGVAIYLPANGNEPDLYTLPPEERITADRVSDEGDEETVAENLSFSNITMNRIYQYPVYIHICENNLFGAVRDVYFDNLHCRCAGMPQVIGKASKPVESVSFSHCTFRQIPENECRWPVTLTPEQRLPRFEHIRSLRMTDTEMCCL